LNKANNAIGGPGLESADPEADKETSYIIFSCFLALILGGMVFFIHWQDSKDPLRTLSRQ
jgi:hypothetical protein